MQLLGEVKILVQLTKSKVWLTTVVHIFSFFFFYEYGRLLYHSLLRGEGEWSGGRCRESGDVGPSCTCFSHIAGVPSPLLFVNRCLDSRFTCRLFLFSLRIMKLQFLCSFSFQWFPVLYMMSFCYKEVCCSIRMYIVAFWNSHQWLPWIAWNCCHTHLILFHKDSVHLHILFQRFLYSLHTASSLQCSRIISYS